LTFAGRVIGSKVKNNYPRVSVLVGSVRSVVLVHVLVASAFLGDRPEGYHINHIDGDKDNNKPTNLEYVTASENNRHAVRSGLNPVHGENNPAAKLTETRVLELRESFRRGASLTEIAAAFGISKSEVSAIVRGKNWKSLDLDDMGRPTLEDDIVAVIRSSKHEVKLSDLPSLLAGRARRQDRGGDITSVLRVLVSRLAQTGRLIRVRKGFYVAK
jgi:hypothetical protein